MILRIALAALLMTASLMGQDKVVFDEPRQSEPVYEFRISYQLEDNQAREVRLKFTAWNDRDGWADCKDPSCSFIVEIAGEKADEYLSWFRNADFKQGEHMEAKIIRWLQSHNDSEGNPYLPPGEVSGDPVP